MGPSSAVNTVVKPTCPTEVRVRLPAVPLKENIMAKKPKLTLLEETKQYVEFLGRRLSSENYKAAVSPEEYALEKKKYDKAKFRLKILNKA